MPFIFKSQATGDLIMLDEPAKRILNIIGKEPNATGIITVAQLQPAIVALEEAIENDRKIREQTQGDNTHAEEDEPLKTLWGNAAISLQQRAWPFIEMLKKSLAAEADVVWGV